MTDEAKKTREQILEHALHNISQGVTNSQAAAKQAIDRYTTADKSTDAGDEPITEEQFRDLVDEAKMPDEVERLICNYTRNDRKAVNRFLGAAKLCGYTLTTAGKALDAGDLLPACENFFDSWFGPAFGPPEHLDRIQKRHEKSKQEFSEKLKAFVLSWQPHPPAVAGDRACSGLKSIMCQLRDCFADDRAEYGEQLLNELPAALTQQNAELVKVRAALVSADKAIYGMDNETHDARLKIEKALTILDRKLNGGG